MNPAFIQVREIVKKEINYLAKLYPYNIRKFFNRNLLHTANILSFNDSKSILEDKFFNKLLNLMAGIELLAAGVKLHSFNADDFVMFSKDISWAPQSKSNFSGEKNYTLDLLFGDIFYSRAAIYIIEYGDYDLFDTILNSLKSVHRNKLLLHQQLVRAVNINKGLSTGKNSSSDKRNINYGKTSMDCRENNYEKRYLKYHETSPPKPLKGCQKAACGKSFMKLQKHNHKKSFAELEKKPDFELKEKITGLIADNETLLTGTNSLLKTSFFIGWAIFSHFKEISFPYSLINNFILLKTFNDLKDFFAHLPGELNFLKNISYLDYRQKQIKEDILKNIDNLKPAWLKKNYRYLQRIYT